MQRIEQAAISAARVFSYAALGSLIGTLGPFDGKHVPDVSTLHNTVVAAAYAGGIAAIGFTWNLLSPRVPVEKN